jgi:alkylation response protein AidB-like acyl-CoA dehydrogenase
MTVDFRFGPDVETFRHEVRTFLDQEMDARAVAHHGDDGDLTGLDEEFERALLRRAGERGFLGISLPTELGGGGRPASFQAAFNLEVAARDAPLIDTAVTLAAQPLLACGSPGQRAFFLPRIIAGELIMCIAYTEPDAGSDLGSLSMVAGSEPDGGFVLTGVKSLVTAAHKADWCLTIARTTPDVPPRAGLTMFLIDMDTAGLSVRRRRTMNHWTLGEIVCDQVRVAPDAVVGRVNDGWAQLAAAVATEGAGMFHIGFARHLFERLVDFTRSAPGGLREDPIVRDRLASLRIELGVAERLAKRAIWLQENGEDNVVFAAMGKVYATELLQRLARAATDISGADGTLYRPLFGPGSSTGSGEGRFAWEYLERVHGTIGGGTNEVKRSLIAQAGLGLPRAPRAK